MHFKLIL